jgi:hypothetical protein
MYVRASAAATTVPLQTRSIVLTWVPSSMVCSVKSISGSGFFSWTARMALSMYLVWSKGCWLLSMVGRRESAATRNWVRCQRAEGPGNEGRVGRVQDPWVAAAAAGKTRAEAAMLGFLFK